ncbi:hypothetical protein Y032_0439g1498 [Ancylostoma ceylanicum]|uniref:Uncharacterized protein n=1 Tax=Ancylostoma ceylanicum TaxID=53326 RepID=A0A016WZT8_9BILA|nr:hypothetical protein Y032_0439g1498 [Ancylostoma ceylanicum]
MRPSSLNRFLLLDYPKIICFIECLFLPGHRPSHLLFVCSISFIHNASKPAKARMELFWTVLMLIQRTQSLTTNSFIQRFK